MMNFKFMKHLLTIAVAGMLFAGCDSEPVRNRTEETAAAAKDLFTLKTALGSVAQSWQAQCAFGYIHVETGDTFSYNGSEHKPMQSTVKFQLEIMVIQRIDSGKLKLDQVIPISKEEMAPYGRSRFR